MNYGQHLTLRLADIERRDVLGEGRRVSEFLVDLVARIKMRILAGPLTAEETDEGEKWGWSSVVILYESHAAIHTYPKLGQAFVDIFSCRPFEVSIVKEMLGDTFGDFTVTEQSLFDRGIHWGNDIEAEMNEWRTLRIGG